ncbi:MAG TPA: DUF4351 domain-containing protein [Nostocaceae cyanobacterium]|nr:DUF4351 domain-containing protein [Nostocaceae cyanobacterium]
MRESVIYQDILQEGEKREALAFLVRLITRRFGELTPDLELRLQNLSVTQLENLGKLLFDFTEISEVYAWLETHQEIE